MTGISNMDGALYLSLSHLTSLEYGNLLLQSHQESEPLHPAISLSDTTQVNLGVTCHLY